MRVLVGLAALSVLGLAPLAAEAATLSYSQFFPGNNNPDASQNPQTFAGTDWDGTTQKVTLPQFSPSLGTLTGVDLLLYGNILTSGSLKNTGASTADINDYSATLDISMLPPGSGATPLTVSPPLFDFTNTSLAPGGSLGFGGAAGGNTSDSGTTSVTDLSPYVGAGSLVFPLSTQTSSNADTTGGNLEIDQSTSARAEVTVTYTYDVAAATPVPEPASAALLGAGLLGLGLLRRRS